MTIYESQKRFSYDPIVDEMWQRIEGAFCLLSQVDHCVLAQKSEDKVLGMLAALENRPLNLKHVYKDLEKMAQNYDCTHSYGDFKNLNCLKYLSDSSPDFLREVYLWWYGMNMNKDAANSWLRKAEKMAGKFKINLFDSTTPPAQHSPEPSAKRPRGMSTPDKVVCGIRQEIGKEFRYIPQSDPQHPTKSHPYGLMGHPEIWFHHCVEALCEFGLIDKSGKQLFSGVDEHAKSILGPLIPFKIRTQVHGIWENENIKTIHEALELWRSETPKIKLLDVILEGVVANAYGQNVPLFSWMQSRRNDSLCLDLRERFITSGDSTMMWVLSGEMESFKSIIDVNKTDLNYLYSQLRRYD